MINNVIIALTATLVLSWGNGIPIEQKTALVANFELLDHIYMMPITPIKWKRDCTDVENSL